VLLVDPAERTDHPQRQLRGAHFHRKTTTGRPFLDGDMLGDVEREGGLAHRGTRRQHDQVARLETGGHAVHVVEARPYAGHLLGAVLVQLVDAIDQLDDELVHADEALARARPFLADPEDLALGLVEDLRDRAPLRIERVGRDLVARRDQLAQHRALAHDLGVAADVGRARHALRRGHSR
jgi:hypothetical protein